MIVIKLKWKMRKISKMFVRSYVRLLVLSSQFSRGNDYFSLESSSHPHFMFHPASPRSSCCCERCEGAGEATLFVDISLFM